MIKVELMHCQRPEKTVLPRRNAGTEFHMLKSNAVSLLGTHNITSNKNNIHLHVLASLQIVSDKSAD